MNFLKYKKQISILLVIFLIAPSFMVAHPSKAEAFPVVERGMNLITNLKNTIESTYTKISAGLTANNSTILAVKETIGDGLVTIAKKTLIRQITTGVVNWINSGFDGSPAFISDFDGFMTDIADRSIGKYIFGSKLKFLCGPIRPAVQLALNNKYYGEVPACRLSGIESNVENAVTNFNIQWDWNTWQSITTDIGSNSYLAFEYSVFGANNDISKAQNSATNKAKMNNGFLSWETCPMSWGSLSASEKDNYFDETDYKSICPGKQTNTPGSVIYSQLNEALPSGLRDLELADEINEIVGAAASQLISQVLGPGGGLFGTSKPSGGGGASFLDRMNSERLVGDDLLASMTDNIKKGISDGEKFLAVKLQSSSIVFQTKDSTEALFACQISELNKLQARLTELNNLDSNSITRTLFDTDGTYFVTATEEIGIVEQGILIARNKIENTQNILNTQINPLYERLNDEINKTNLTLTELKSLQSEVPTLTKETILDAQQKYEEMQSGVKTQSDVINAKQERDGFPAENAPGEPKGITRDMAAIDNTIAPLMEECQAFTVVGYIESSIL